MLENKNSNLELKIRVLKAEIREAKREADKDYDMAWYFIIAFIFAIIAFPYFYFIRQEKELWKVISFMVILLIAPVISFYCFKSQTRKKEQIEQLEKELTLLKKDLKKD